ncbi:5-oxoprolinase subunit PxpB [Algicola sagamiensis]|uniref:5-oxoprolinase subunit PxpB n=1 Tax=Algicola sagamiensis TaxID=163869 RepID=UPI00037D6D0B|nr:5-oxoprolinase subunit PxpB [Algicola sagamiensis]
MIPWQYDINPINVDALRVRFHTSPSPELCHVLQSLRKSIIMQFPESIQDVIPAYQTLMIQFQFLQLSTDMLTDFIEHTLQNMEYLPKFSPKHHQIPTRYDGMDLHRVASLCNLTPEEVIQLHSGRQFTVYCLGFLPGFPYLGPLDSSLFLPRLKNPRKQVPAGSVGIAEHQTGIYPINSPGGWHIIGTTDVTLYDPQHPDQCPFEVGDIVEFVPIFFNSCK